IEIGFESKPGGYLISGAVNILEALTDASALVDKEPASGGGLFMAGGGKLLLALSSRLAFSADDLKAYPEIAEAWGKLTGVLEALNITGKNLEAMLNGYLTIAFGSEATIMGMKTSGGYVALTGRKGAAADILGRFIGNPLIAENMPLVPLKADGWDVLYAVNPSAAPAPLLLGLMKDTLFVGVVDSDALVKTPEVSPEVARMLEVPLFGLGFIDAAAIWSLLRREAADPNSLLYMAPGLEDFRGFLIEALEAELSVPLVKMWYPEPGTAFMEFSVADVPEDKRLLPRLSRITQMIVAGETMPVPAGPMSDADFIELCKSGTSEDIAAAIGNGANVNARDQDGQTPLMIVVQRKTTPEFASFLIQNGANVNARAQNGRTALMLAAGYNTSPEVITFLIDNGADARAVDGDGKSVGDYASENAALRAYRQLLAASGLEMAESGMSDEEFLALCRTGTATEVEAAVKGGANVNARDEYGETALMLAARSTRDPEVVSVLLRHGADASIRDDDGRSAFDYASVNARLRNTDAYRQLLEASEIDMSDEDFLELCKSGTAHEIEAAIKNGANVNAADDKGTTALMHAAYGNPNPEVISVLLKNGADAHARDEDGKRAIDHASENENIKGTNAYWELNDAGF
ncbi:MAG: ankyrin repeat domain-containing protein, partial [Synergistaceae bacterium]|nr:ankyrin repeat domain-containing protein [Synergistaceae bacterium]